MLKSHECVVERIEALKSELAGSRWRQQRVEYWVKRLRTSRAGLSAVSEQRLQEERQQAGSLWTNLHLYSKPPGRWNPCFNLVETPIQPKMTVDFEDCVKDSPRFRWAQETQYPKTSPWTVERINSLHVCWCLWGIPSLIPTFNMCLLRLKCDALIVSGKQHFYPAHAGLRSQFGASVGLCAFFSSLISYSRHHDYDEQCSHMSCHMDSRRHSSQFISIHLTFTIRYDYYYSWSN